MNDSVTGTIERSALVIGGSIAGLVAARVLIDHFDRVTIVERDQLPNGLEPRAGVPQARHVHVLLQKGQQILEEFFPGLQDELAAAGAQRIDWLADCLWYIPHVWAPRFASDLVTRFCSRDLLEWTIRRRLATNPKVTLMPERDVIGLVGDTNNERVIGVRVRHRNAGEQSAERVEEIHADLIIDASGRESRAPQWLESIGYAAPQETRINSFLGYSSRFYRRPPSAGADWKAVLVRAVPPTSTRGAGIFPIEGNRWMVNIGSAQRDYPPTDEAGFLEFTHSLPDPLIYNTIKEAEPLSPIYGYRRTENRIRYFERLQRVPENFVALGDAVCAFNPVYGQGMTVAAQGAVALDDCLREQQRRAPNGDLTGLAKRFQKKLAQVNQVPWMLATNVDFQYPATEGGKPGRLSRLTSGYMANLARLSMEDPFVHLTFIQVLHLLKPPSVLFYPKIAFAVLRYSIKQRTSAETDHKTKSNNLNRMTEGYR